MTRTVIQEPNFTSIFWEARPGSGGFTPVPAELEINLSVHLAPMDPSKPYNALRSDAPQLFGSLFSPEVRELFWPSKANLAFHTHLADTPEQRRKGFVFDVADPPHKFRARSWMRGEFDKFKSDFKRLVELSWDNQMILLPPEDPKDGLSDDRYMDLVGNPNIPAHVVCSLTIRMVDDPGNANAVIQVVRLCRDDDPSINRKVAPRPGEEEFQSFAWLICNEDIHRQNNASYQWPSIRISQIAAAHEIGHWLGRPSPLGDLDRFVDHIDGAKYPKTNPNYHELQYGGTPSHRAALLGAGSVATQYEANAWINRIRRHTKALFGWRFVHRLHFLGLVPVSARQKSLVSQRAAPLPTGP